MDPAARGRRRTQRVLLVATAFAVALGVASTSVRAADVPTAETPLTARQLRARARTTAWIVDWDHDRVITSLTEHQRLIGRISPFWFELRRDGRAVSSRPGAMDADVLAIAARRRMAVVPTVSNEVDPARVTEMLRTPARRRAHVAQLVALASRPAFAGIDVDYEGVSASDRAAFTAFVRELADGLHARHRTLSVSVPATTSSNETDPGAGAIDYHAIGAVADEVRVMAYDYNWSCGGSGPVAPIGWVEQSITYLRTLVPARRLVLGVPLYGYDWPTEGCAVSRTWADLDVIRTRYQATVTWSAPLQSRSLRYVAQRRRRTAWFEDAAATAAKARLVERYRLRGVALWRIGGEDPRTWQVLEVVLGAPRT